MVATAKTETLMPLDKFAAILGIHPLHFNQVRLDTVKVCGKVWLQYDWQGPDAISRESVALAVQSAENDLEQFLGYSVAPQWYADVELPTPGINGTLLLPKAYYITGGAKAKVLIEAGSAITYSDEDMDGYDETATVTVTTDIDPSEIAIYYPDTDGSEAWHIRPVKVTVSSGTATITLNRHDLVLKDELEALMPTAIDGLDDTKFLETVDVYRVYTDPSIQAIIKSMHHHCGICISGCDSCVFTEHDGCILGRDKRNSEVMVSKANWNTETKVWQSDHHNPIQHPFAVRTWFRAGWTGDPIWDQAVAYLALSRLNVGLCSCPAIQSRLNWWTTELIKSDATASFRMPIRSNMATDSPWGWTRGALFAFSIALKHQMPQGQIA